MAEVKWVKLYIDIFESNDKIKKIRRLPCGNEIVLLWIILLCKAGKCNDGGRIYVTPSEPYAPEDIADDYKFEINTVKLGLEALCRFNMIEISDDGIIYVLNWEEYQNVEGMEKIREQNRLRQAKRRGKEKQALIGGGNVCEYCGNEGTTVDHLIPKSKGGLDVPDNTVCSCLACNMRKTNRDLDVFLNEMMATSVDFELDRIISNKKIMKYVVFDDLTSKFMSRDITGQVTVRHATDKEIRNKNKDKEIKTTTTNNYHSFLQSEEFALFQRVCEAFGACEAKCSADVIDDFIAYNEARGWVGIGGESVLDNLERYAARWARGEDARGRTSK